MLSPDPQMMPRHGLRSLGSDTRLDIVASEAAYGRDITMWYSCQLVNKEGLFFKAIANGDESSYDEATMRQVILIGILGSSAAGL